MDREVRRRSVPTAPALPCQRAVAVDEYDHRINIRPVLSMNLPNTSGTVNGPAEGATPRRSPGGTVGGAGERFGRGTAGGAWTPKRNRSGRPPQDRSGGPPNLYGEVMSVELRIPPVVVLLLTALAMYLARGAAPSFAFTAPFARPVAWAALALGVGCATAGAAAFQRAGTTLSPTNPGEASALVREGIYRHTRNPMYLGMLLVLTAWGLWLGHWLSLALVSAFVLYMNRFQIGVEERILEEKFGAAYVQYKAEVRRWL